MITLIVAAAFQAMDNQLAQVNALKTSV